MPQADPKTTGRAESASERLEQLLQVRIPAGCVSRDQLVCRPASVPASEPAQPAGIQATGGYDVLSALPEAWTRTLDVLMRGPLTKVFRRAGCGKPARPVRRGDGGPQIQSVTLRPTLLA